MNPDVREKLEALNAALEAPVPPASLYDVDAIAALINRFAKGVNNGPAAYAVEHMVRDYSAMLLRTLAAKEGERITQDGSMRFMP